MSMNLSDLHSDPGSRPKRRRLGRGHGSGRGKTAGKGTKGQLARAGANVPAWFEGGQNALIHRMPVKRGFQFKNPTRRIQPDTVNLRQLSAFSAGQTVDREALVAAGLVDHRARRVKILGDGELSYALIISAEEFSAGARTKIEAAGGQVIVVGATVVQEG